MALEAHQYPTVKYIPSWLPGAGFKRKAAAWKTVIERGADEPFQWVKNSMVGRFRLLPAPVQRGMDSPPSL